MQSNIGIKPITIHYYRNHTQTTENTFQIKQTNQTSSRNINRIEQRLPKIQTIHHLVTHITHQRDQILKSNQKNKTPSISPKKLEQGNNFHVLNKNVKNKLTKDNFEPILSSAPRHSPTQQISSNKIIISQEKDIKQFTFGNRYYQKKNPEKILKPSFSMVVKGSEKNQFHKKNNINRLETHNIRKQSQEKIEGSRKIKAHSHLEMLQDKHRNPGKYAVGKQIGLTQLEIYIGKNVNIQHQLEQFIRKKGLQYLKDSKIQGRSESHKVLKTEKTQPLQKKNQQKRSSKVLLKHKEVLKCQKGKIANQKSELPKISVKKKRIKTEGILEEKVKKSIDKARETKQKQDKKYIKINDKQQMLGKLVLEKVEEYFKICKEKKHNYFTAVKSEDNIQKAWTQFLKTKVDRANYVLSHQ